MKKTSIVALFFTLLSFGAHAQDAASPSNNLPASKAEAFQEAMQKQVMQDFQLFKEWFNVDIKSGEEFQDFGQKRIVSYLTKLRTCTPGIYTYAVHLPTDLDQAKQGEPAPVYGLETSTIKGLDKGGCQVNSDYMVRGHMVEAQCSFSAKTLSLYSDDFAVPFFEHGNFGPFAYENNKDLYTQVQNECKIVKAH